MSGMMPSNLQKSGKKRKFESICFPKVVAEIIVEYAANYEISPWIREICGGKLGFVCRNPMAMDLISSSEISIQWYFLCENPAEWAVDLIFQQIERGVIKPGMFASSLANNTNPRIFPFVEQQFPKPKSPFQDYCKVYLSKNPCAISFLRKHPELIHPVFIMCNPMAKELIEEMKLPIQYDFLASNDAEWAVDLLLQHYKETGQVYKQMSNNKNQEILKLLFTRPDKVCWVSLSRNPAAIDYLRANPDEVDRNDIQVNPAAFEFTLRDALLALLLDL